MEVRRFGCKFMYWRLICLEFKRWFVFLNVDVRELNDVSEELKDFDEVKESCYYWRRGFVSSFRN